MRTKELKVNGTKVEAILMAGGPGFKIYSANSHLVLVLGRKVNIIDEDSIDFKTVMHYITLKYQSESDREDIKSAFKTLLTKLGE